MGLFVVLPAALLLRETNAPVLVAFVAMFAVCQTALLRGRARDRTRTDTARVPRSEWRRIVSRFAVLGTGLTVGVWLLAPEALFDLPRRAPALWLLVILLYPLLSAYPQEVIYRAFMFRRYAALFVTDGRMVLATALAFGWLHLLLENGVAVVLTLAGGWMFGDTYRRTRSLAAVSVEHALYGLLVFTIGLGRAFYLGAVRP